MQALLPNFFILRRVLLALILFYLNSFAGVQLMAHYLVSLMYVGYLLCYKPYNSVESNIMQVKNEISVMLCSYVLMLTLSLSTNTDDSKSIDAKYNIGFLYILFNSALLVSNVYGIVKTALTGTLP